MIGWNDSSPRKNDHRLVKARLVHPESGPRGANAPNSIDGRVLGLREAFLDELSQLGLQCVHLGLGLFSGFLQLDDDDDVF